MVTRQSLRAFREQGDQSDDRILASGSWHTKSTRIVLESFETNSNGLSKEEANKRLAKYGLNQSPEAKTRGSLVRFFYQFHNTLIYVLISASAVTAMLGHWIDASVILGVVLINAVIGFVQEGKAEERYQVL